MDSHRGFCGRPGGLRATPARPGQLRRRHADAGAAPRLTGAQPATVTGHAAADPPGQTRDVGDADASATPHGAAHSNGNTIPGRRPGHLHPGSDANSLRHRLGGSDSGDIAFLMPPAAPPTEYIAARKEAMRRMFR
jgi:hypothetical protein